MSTLSTFAEAAQAVERAPSLDRVVAVIAEFLGAHRPVDRVSLRVLLPEEHALLVVAVWSRSPTTITPGLRISEAASSLPEVLKANAPVVVGEASRAELLDDVLASEGIRSWVTAPLREGSQIRALLSVSSDVPGAFSDSDASPFAEFAASVERHVFELIRASGEFPAD